LAGHTKMAATGFTPISLYYTTTASAAPTAGNLVAGELAINTNDGKLFYKDSSGVVQTIASKAGALGDVVGPASATDNAISRFDATTGKLIQNSLVTVSDTGAISAPVDASISGLTVGKGGGAIANNTAVGSGALAGANTGAGRNTAIGRNSLGSNTSATDNSSFGDSALGSNTTGLYNNAFGRTSMLSNTTGGSNSAFSYESLYSNTTGSNNVAIGNSALYSNTTASNNTAVGYQAGNAITTGASNVFVGYLAGQNLSTGSYNIYIGQRTNNSGAGISGAIVLGAGSSDVTDKGSNTGFISPNGGGVYQGNNSAAWSITSDARLKKNIVDNTIGLNAISQIQVRNFEYRTADEITDLPKQTAIEISGVQLGAVAQEIQAILPDCVKTESTGVMSVDTTNLTWYLINAVKELNAKITALENK